MRTGPGDPGAGTNRSRVRHRHGPASLLACARGRWAIEHQHWLRDVVWHEDKSTIRTGHAPQVISALINLVITLFRLQGVTRITEETRRNAQNPSRPLQLLALRPG
jgi:hypothetical protein